MSHFEINTYSREQWNPISNVGFQATFGFNREASLERYDFVLAAVDENKDLSGWITCKEMDAETLYWQYGGAHPKYFNTTNVMLGYIKFISFCMKTYKRITTRIENKNFPMLKLALRLGFLVVGVSNFEGKIYLELMYDKKH